MKRFKGALPLLFLMTILTATQARADWETYVAVKGGGFFPNGRGGSTTSSENGFSNFSQGFNGEVAVGIRPESYAALELGGGYYSTDADIAETSGYTNRFTASAVPVTLTAKGILPYGRLEAFAGAGIGYWSARLRYQQFNTGTGKPSEERNVNAGALGYLVVAGADYRLTDRIDLGTEAKWSSARPEFDFTETQTFGKKVKWEFGGTAVNLVVKYRF